jgi:hypothetical protein
MSETIAQTVMNEMAAEAAAAAAAQAPVAETPVVAAEPVAAEPEVAEAPAEPAPKPKQSDRRFAHLTAKLASEAAAREAAERRATAAEALLNAGKDTPAPLQGETIEQAATRLIAQRDYDARLSSVVTEGRKEFGETEWLAKAEVLRQLGATVNGTFMQTLVEMPGSVKLVMHWLNFLGSRPLLWLLQWGAWLLN